MNTFAPRLNRNTFEPRALASGILRGTLDRSLAHRLWGAAILLARSSALALWLCSLACAALLRIEVNERSDVLNGRAFGRAGAYERLIGRTYFALDPKHPLNSRITDIERAPRHAGGLVDFSADLYVLKPRDPARGNGVVLYEPPNRGRKNLLSMFQRARDSQDPRREEEFGDGMLLADGYTIVWLGWQHDVPGRDHLLRLHAPVAAGVTGLVRSEFTPDRKTRRIPLGDSGHIAYPVVRIEQLTVRDAIASARRILPRSDWRIEGTEIVLKNEAQPGKIYEAVYTAKDPAVAGVGLAAIRDLISFLKYGGNNVTPLGDQRRFLRHALGFGVSQSAMLLKALIYAGFNQDERNRQVFDGILAHVAGGRRSTFERFVQPSRTAGPLRNASFTPTDQFPYSDVEQHDPELGRSDGVLARARGAGKVPKIFYTNSSYEYWGASSSLIHTTVDGKDDAPLPATTRVYVFAGGQHGPARFPPQPGRGQNLPNPNNYRWVLRALLPGLQRWVAGAEEPPASQYPFVKTGTLVGVAQLRFPAIPGVAVPRHTHLPYRLYFGPHFHSKGVANIQPPRIGSAYGIRVPQVDGDGNDIPGIRMPQVAVPLATYTGWNLRNPAIGASTELLGSTGSYIPFPRTIAQRIVQKDPRASIEERYSSRDEYLARIRRHAENLARERYLLERDVLELVKEAADHWDWIMSTDASETGSR